jgi:hypothetical protein
MSLFQQSALTYTSAKNQVARSAGMVTDPDLSTMAAQAVVQAIERWNNKKAWTFLLTTAPTFSFDSSLGQDYNLPADFAGPYSVRDITNKRNFMPIQQRLWDWGDPTATPGAPIMYGMFQQGGDGKLRLYPIPSNSGKISLKYYRQLTLPMESLTVSGCASSATRITFASSSSSIGSDILTVSSGASTCRVGEVLTTQNGFAAGATIKDIISDTQIQMSVAATGGSTDPASFGNTILTTSSGTFAGVRRGAGITVSGVATGTTIQRILSLTQVELSQPVSTAVASGVSTISSESQLLDIPANFERGILALAKFYYLRDKGGDEERIQGWKREADEAFAEAMANDATTPEEQPGFLPGYLGPDTTYPASPNDIRWAWAEW